METLTPTEAAVPVRFDYGRMAMKHFETTSRSSGWAA